MLAHHDRGHAGVYDKLDSAIRGQSDSLRPFAAPSTNGSSGPEAELGIIDDFGKYGRKNAPIFGFLRRGGPRELEGWNVNVLQTSLIEFDTSAFLLAFIHDVSTNLHGSSVSVRFQIKVHQRLGTQFKLFVECDGDPTPVVDFLKGEDGVIEPEAVSHTKGARLLSSQEI